MNEGSRTMGIWRWQLHLFGSSTIAPKAMRQIHIFIPRWRIMMQNTTLERWADSIRVNAITIMKDFFCLMRAILLIIRSITGSSVLYSKGWSYCSGSLGIFWWSSLYFALVPCTHLPTVRNLWSPTSANSIF